MADQQMPTTGSKNLTGPTEPSSAADDVTRAPQQQKEPAITTSSGAPNEIGVPVEVHDSEVEEDTEDVSGVKKAKGAVVEGLKKLRGDPKSSRSRIKVLNMSQEDYLKYWAKDEDGNYTGTEPEGEGRRLWAEELKKAA
jgi:hypothetical protein